jgi:hypothetical protein
MDFLTHVLFHEHVKFDLEKVQVVKEWQNLTIVNYFFRLDNFCKKFIKDFFGIGQTYH